MHSASSGNPPRILVVEDEPLIAADIVATLEKLGYAPCGKAADFAGAARLAMAERPDLVLMDIHLKGELDGIDAAGKIGIDDIPIVYLTAYADDSTVKRASATNAYGYLLKPFDEAKLNAAIQIALARHRAEKKLTELIAALETDLEVARNDAVIDPLTKLWNQKGLARLLDAEIRRAERDGQRIAVMLLDVDHFKHVNDTFGAQVGAEILREVADRIRELAQPSDIVARLGGDQFLIVSGPTSDAAAGALAERMSTGLAGQPFTAFSRQISLTVSIGVAASATALDTLIEHANAALQTVRSEGGNGFRLVSLPGKLQRAGVRERAPAVS
jgi:diguanylate cyclase (GGDEF)-like protein